MENANPRNEVDEELFQKALKLRSVGDLGEARGILEDLSKRYPDDLLVLLIYGGVVFNLDNYSEAKSVFQKILESRPANEASSLGLFHSLWQLGEWRAALQEMERFLALAKSSEYEKLKKDFEEAMRVAEDEASANEV